jgi:hypothetical protein
MPGEMTDNIANRVRRSPSGHVFGARRRCLSGPATEFRLSSAWSVECADESALVPVDNQVCNSDSRPPPGAAPGLGTRDFPIDERNSASHRRPSMNDARGVVTNTTSTQQMDCHSGRESMRCPVVPIAWRRECHNA